MHKKSIRLKMLRKLNEYFPDERAQAIIDKCHAEKQSVQTRVDNPFYGDESKKVFLSLGAEPNASLFNLIETAILKKANKNHQNKPHTTLVIDNRTCMFDIQNYQAISEQFEDLRSKCPFREVWFYTGFYSNNDGSNAEWSVSPILIEDITEEQIKTACQEIEVFANECGIIYDAL